MLLCVMLMKHADDVDAAAHTLVAGGDKSRVQRQQRKQVLSTAQRLEATHSMHSVLHAAGMPICAQPVCNQWPASNVPAQFSSLHSRVNFEAYSCTAQAASCTLCDATSR
jgi:hypothetical protein